MAEWETDGTWTGGVLGRAATRTLDLIIALRPRLETPFTNCVFLTRPRFNDVLVGRDRLRFETFAARSMKAPPDAFFCTQIVDPSPSRVHLPFTSSLRGHRVPSRLVSTEQSRLGVNDVAANNVPALLPTRDRQ